MMLDIAVALVVVAAACTAAAAGADYRLRAAPAAWVSIAAVCGLAAWAALALAAAARWGVAGYLGATAWGAAGLAPAAAAALRRRYARAGWYGGMRAADAWALAALAPWGPLGLVAWLVAQREDRRSWAGYAAYPGLPAVGVATGACAIALVGATAGAGWAVAFAGVLTVVAASGWLAACGAQTDHSRQGGALGRLWPAERTLWALTAANRRFAATLAAYLRQAGVITTDAVPATAWEWGAGLVPVPPDVRALAAIGDPDDPRVLRAVWAAALRDAPPSSPLEAARLAARLGLPRRPRGRPGTTARPDGPGALAHPVACACSACLTARAVAGARHDVALVEAVRAMAGDEAATAEARRIVRRWAAAGRSRATTAAAGRRRQAAIARTAALARTGAAAGTVADRFSGGL